MKKHIGWSLFALLAALALAAGGLRGERGFSADTQAQRRLAALQKAIAAEGLNWQAGETSLSRLSAEEQRRRLGARPAFLVGEDGSAAAAPDPAPAALPAVFDWRDHAGNWVTAVRDQGTCGSCWAFATVGVLESLVKIAHGAANDIDLSEQTLVNCSGAGDCEGGYMHLAAEFLRKTGAPREECYPYAASDGLCSPCPGWMARTVRVTSWNSYSNRSKAVLQAAVVQAPIAAFMEVYSDLYSYRSGVYARTSGAVYRGGHGVLIVGYNDSEGYWICKNSWGSDWGESGFFRIRMGDCDIASYAVSLSGPRLENQPPELQDIPAQAVDEGKPLAFTLAASDPDYDKLLYSASPLPAGAVLDPETGVFSWTPSFTQSGAYTVLFTASDGLSATSKAATITVANIKYKTW